MLIFSIVVGVTNNILQIGGLKMDVSWWPFVFMIFKNVFSFVTILLVVALILIIISFKAVQTKISAAIGEALESGKLSKETAVVQWQEVTKKMSSEDIEEAKNALEMAENLLDNALRVVSYGGESLEQRILSIPENQLSSRDNLLWACRVKYNANAEIADIQKAIYYLEKSMKELNIL